MNLAVDLFKNPVDATVQAPRYRKGKKSRVSTANQPVRDIVETATITGGAGRLRPPVGTVYTVTFLDGTKREIYVELNDRWQPYFDFCHFLQPGRTTTLLSEVLKLKITDFNDRPPRHVIERMKADAAARGVTFAQIPSVS